MVALVFIVLLGLTAVISFLVVLVSKTPTRSVYEDSINPKHALVLVSGLSLLAAIGLWLIASIAVIPNGHVAVMTRFQKVTGKVLEAGFNWKSVIETPVKMSVQTQLFSDDAAAASKDLQDVSATIAINYRLNAEQAPTVYRTIGHDYIRVVAHPLVQETVKEVTARYDAENMILRRAEVKADMSDEIKTKLAERGIIAEEVNITNFSFSDEFEKAIDAKVVAVQSVLEAENKLRQIEVEARQAEQQAKGEAAAAIARAEGQAEANRIVAESLTPEILRYYFIDKMGADVKVWVVPESQAFTISP